MAPTLTTQPIRVAISRHGDEGCLVMADDLLVAVLVLLSDQYGPEAGRWYLETGYGPVDGLSHPTFADLGEAQEWIGQRLDSRR